VAVGAAVVAACCNAVVGAGVAVARGALVGVFLAATVGAMFREGEQAASSSPRVIAPRPWLCVLTVLFG